MATVIEVSNLGPLRSARAEVADLTLLIGENNAGKTFFATVLHRVLRASFLSWSASPWTTRSFSEEVPDEVLEWINDHVIHSGADTLPLESPPLQPSKALAEWAVQFTSASLRSFGNDVRDAIEYAFGAEATELRRKTSHGKASDCYLRVRNTGPDWGVEIRFDSPSVTVDPPDPGHWLARLVDRIRQQVENPRSRTGWFWSPEEGLAYPWRRHRTWVADLFVGWPRYAVHLPAGRTGIVQSYEVLAGAVIRQSAVAGIRPIEIPSLPGTSADFLSLILESRSYHRRHVKTRPLIKGFEDQLGIAVEINPDEKSGDIVVAVTSEGRFPLSRVSSMISELAPMLLVLKDPVRRVDHLTIDEPEAHLHPGMQVKLAEFLTNLAKYGLRMVVTTHSDFYLGELNNLIREGNLNIGRSVNESTSEGFNVGALQFLREDDGCIGRILELDSIDGIDESTFTDVMESLYDKSVSLINDLIEGS